MTEQATDIASGDDHSPREKLFECGGELWSEVTHRTAWTILPVGFWRLARWTIRAAGASVRQAWPFRFSGFWARVWNR